ncbi:MAG: zf-HC2 domain-containing protein [Actinomycetota bacterium]|nr:zf-HC2 domain-containing protein [Actinomycetota bacterium]
MTRRQHRRLSRTVDAWVDGELDAERTSLVVAHLDDCWDCSAAAEMARLIKRSLRLRCDRQPPGIAATRLRRFADGLPQRS